MEDIEVRFIGITFNKQIIKAVIDYPDIEQKKCERFFGHIEKTGIDKLISRLKKSDRIAIAYSGISFFLEKEIKNRVGCEVYVLNTKMVTQIYKVTKKRGLDDAGRLAWILKRLLPEELPTVTLIILLEEQLDLINKDKEEKKRNRNC